MIKKLLLSSWVFITLFCRAMQENYTEYIQFLKSNDYFEQIMTLPDETTFKGWGPFNDEGYKVIMQLWTRSKAFKYVGKKALVESPTTKVLNVITGLYAFSLNDKDDDFDYEKPLGNQDFSEPITMNKQKTLILLGVPNTNIVHVLKKTPFFSKQILNDYTFTFSHEQSKPTFNIHPIFKNQRSLISFADRETKICAKVKHGPINIACGRAILFFYENVFPQYLAQVFKHHLLNYSSFPSSMQQEIEKDPTFIILHTLEINDDFQRQGLGTALFSRIKEELQEKYSDYVMFWLASPSSGTLQELCSFYKKCGGIILHQDMQWAIFYLRYKSNQSKLTDQAG
jgi:GNAT superfamily N-acetyltransferase